MVNSTTKNLPNSTNYINYMNSTNFKTKEKEKHKHVIKQWASFLSKIMSCHRGQTDR